MENQSVVDKESIQAKIAFDRSSEDRTFWNLLYTHLMGAAGAIGTHKLGKESGRVCRDCKRKME